MKPGSLDLPAHAIAAALHPFKLRILKLLLACGIISLLVIWALEEYSGLIIQLDRIAYPIMVIVFLGCLIAISSWPQVLGIAEKVSFGTFAVYVIAQLLSIIFDLQTDSSLYSITTLAQWLPLIYIAAFIFFDTLGAISMSILIYVLLVGPILVFLFLTGSSTAQSNSHAILLNLLWAHPVYIIFLMSIAWLKTHLIMARADASVMRTAANVDYLTGVANRRAAAHMLQAALIEAQASDGALAVLLLDIDHFKQINDEFGHDVGDQVLIDLSVALRGQLRATDTFGRWGGEEFIVIVRQATIAAATDLAERLRAFVEQRPSPQPRPITLSLGGALARPGDTPESLVKRADEVLYRAKQGGRNRVEIWGTTDVEAGAPPPTA